MTIASNFPAIKPSLMLDFANTKRLDPRVTFTRATTGTYYDGVTTAKAEENLLLYSQEFDVVAGWTPIRSSISGNTTTAPDGTSTAESLIEDNTASSTHFVQINTSTAGNFNGTVANPSTYTFSVFAKANTRTEICLGFYDGSTTHTAFFDLSGGTVLSSSGVTASIVSVGNSWYRCIGVRTNSTTTMALSIQLAVSGSRTYTGDGTSGVYIWGAQVEQRSAVTSYTATTTQPITNYIPVLLTAASGVPRFDHNPTTDESLGLLIEEQRTNLLTYSADFSNAAWLKARSSITANTIVAPDGTLTGDKLVEDTTASNTHYVYGNNITITANTNYTFSVYIKAGERTFAAIDLINGSGVNGACVGVNLTTGATGTAFARGTGSSISSSSTSVGNGWWRVSITCIVDNSSTTADCIIYSATSLISSGYPSYTGDGYSGIFIWGAQLEAGAFPTSYIATTSATVTRNADAASMTGTNFSSWFSNAEGTLYAEINPKALAASSGAVINDNTTSNRIRVATASTSDQTLITTSGTAQATLDAGTPVIDTSMKLASAYKVNDFALSLNGGTVATDTAGTVPVVTQLQIGAETTTIGTLTIRKLAYYPLRVTNAQLQALTS